MKIKIILLAFLLLATVLPSQLIAQQYANPDASRMRLLLAKIADCNNDLKELETELAAYINNESEMSLELYRQLKKNIGIVKRCKAASQQQYDDLRADYEGWFNSDTVFSLDRQRLTAHWLSQYIEGMVMMYLKVFKMFNGIPVPEH